MKKLTEQMVEAGYYRGNALKMDSGLYLDRWYAGSPGLPEPKFGYEVVLQGGFVHLVKGFGTYKTERSFVSVPALMNYLKEEGKVSEQGTREWSQGMFDG